MFELERVEVPAEQLGTANPEERWTINGWEPDEHSPWLGAAGTNLADAQEWAKRVIHATTDYRITGWDDRHPTLTKLIHTLDIITTDSPEATKLTIGTGTHARHMLGMLGNPNAVWVVEHGAGTLHIPVRHITFVNHVITTIQV
jgi:hypothetical protein